MKSKLALTILLALVAIPSLALAQDPSNFPLTPVCDLNIDNDGDCIADASSPSDTVCVRGIVIAWKQYGSRGPGAIYDPVSGCCISIFDISGQPDLAIGTSVEVCGWVGNFAGLAEIIDQPGNGSNDPVVTVLDPGPLPVLCTPISGADMADDSPTAEALESCLVSVCGSFVDTGDFLPFSANYDFVDIEGNTLEVRIDSDTGINGTPIPAGNVTVKGVFGQFNGFSDTCVGYQLLPRSTADFLPPTCEVNLDILPQGCGNPFNTTSQGLLPVAILGSANLDVNDIDVSSLRLEGVAPVNSAVEDVSTPASGTDDCPCTEAGADGFDDLTLKFKRQDIAAAFSTTLSHGEVKTLTLTGSFLDGTAFAGTDCITIRVPGGTSGRAGGTSLSISREQRTSLNRISYVVAQDGHVKLGVYDVAGRLVEQLHDGMQPAGRYDALWDSGSQPTGIYFVRLEDRTRVISDKFLILEK